MELTEDIKNYIDKSVLCWLATVSHDNIPNVSPKECFTYFGKDSIIIANIASPQTVKNIGQNENVCISFIDIWVQKGFQIKGKAIIVKKEHPEFEAMETSLNKITKGKFPFSTITKIVVESAKPIVAPSYLLYPDTTSEEAQIANARRTYGI